MLNNTSTISQGKFKVLVLAVFVSIVYDVVWFYLKHSEYTSETDGSAEIGIKYLNELSRTFNFLINLFKYLIGHSYISFKAMPDKYFPKAFDCDRLESKLNKHDRRRSIHSVNSCMGNGVRDTKCLYFISKDSRCRQLSKLFDQMAD